MDMVDVTDILLGNLTADAQDGIADFTDLDVIKAGTGYRLEFTMLPEWQVQVVYTGVFSVKAGPATNLRLKNQPSIKGITSEALPSQPVVELIDKFGNFNVQSIPTTVSVTISPLDAEVFPGWNGGSTLHNMTGSVGGLATFTQLTLYGLGSWYIDFQATLNFRATSVRAETPIYLNQLTVPIVYMTFSMEFSLWTTDSENSLLTTLSDVCNLEKQALEIVTVDPGSVIVGLAFYVPDPAPLWKLVAADFERDDSKFKALGAMSFTSPGFSLELEVPPPPPPPPILKPYTGLPFDVVTFWTELTQAMVISAYTVGLGMAIFTEIAASFAQSARASELSCPEGEPTHGSRWHTGAGLQSGGAFRSLITHVQFVAALSSIGGRGGQVQFSFTFPEPILRGTGNFTFHNTSDIPDVRLPHGARTLADKLDWTNLRSNITHILGNSELFPRPCDVYAQQITIGATFDFAF